MIPICDKFIIWSDNYCIKKAKTRILFNFMRELKSSMETVKHIQ